MIEIRLEEYRRRAAAYEGEKLTGVCEYQRHFDDWIITHTETDPAYGGQGIARRLVECVLNKAESEGGSVTTTCSYARKVMTERTK
ncbi:GNAT family N-acetyltransferase [Hornefia butyriciproducens]|uniref:GNAT family N-acetyltransferase n=1 Tax=Hornefia butyriciproducens TaxID=2652293 RepID=UPI0023F2048B|nr:GNAT family N-acetyltransferase [Hornefia butyriciproducens]MDD6298693.1 GNAT family N-acetyltransferase [Hornefia butyriciproducens]